MRNKDYVLIGAFFYIGWFGCIYFAKMNQSYLSMIFPFILIASLRARDQLRLHEIILAAGITGVGVLFDFLLDQFGFISIKGDTKLLIPIWLIAIWLLFAFSIVKLAARLQIPIWLAVLLGSIMGPVSYKSGEFFNVLNFTSSLTFLIYAVFWAVLFPMILNIYKRLA